MPTLVAGSIASDHLMHFPGRFADQLLADQLHKVSLSFLVDALDVKNGGVAANISYGMAQLGGAPVMVGNVGEDFEPYRAFLQAAGVNCDHVRVSESKHTARFVCTTDEDLNQIGSFYAGAMSEATDIDIAPIWTATGADLAVISAYDPAGMVQHSAECRDKGFRFVADPSQQITRMDGDALKQLIEGAELLFTNSYERELLESKTGFATSDIDAQVDVRITTHGADGAEIVGEFGTITVPVAKIRKQADPTGVGDAFRGGFLTALEWGLHYERAAQVGSLLAALVLEADGPQEYTVQNAVFLERLAESYGDDSAAEVEPRLT